MNLRDKVGQRLMVNFAGPELTPAVARFLVETRAGGIIHFGYNLTSQAQITRLNGELQDLAARHGLPPFLIAVDEEGGRVSRMPGEAARLIAPSQMAQAAAGSDAPASCAGVTARLLRRLGFNLNFAPVADVNNNPANPVIATRAYGHDPAQVARQVAAAVQAYLAHGLAPCVKHFPGHGDTEVDSHLGLPVVAHSRARLEQIELEPFRAAFAAGVPALMTAHILYPQIEPGGLPATLSPFFLTDLLRGELGFEGVVFSDALQMKAIADRYTVPAASLLTLQAGADVAMPLGSFQQQRECAERLVAEGDKLDHAPALARLLAFKERFCLPPAPFDPAQAQTDADMIESVARRSITLVGDSAARTHLAALSRQSPMRPLVLDFELPLASQVEEGRRPGPLLQSLLAAHWPNLQYLALPALDSVENEAALLDQARTADLVLILTRNARRLPDQARFVQSVVDVQPNTFLIAARDPYDLTLVPSAPVRLATYGDPPSSIQALAAVLLGETTPTGVLPVVL